MKKIILLFAGSFFVTAVFSASLKVFFGTLDPVLYLGHPGSANPFTGD